MSRVGEPGILESVFIRPGWARCVTAALAATVLTASAAAQPTRTVRADIVALDQLLVYNRFGSFNPFGMVFALRRDVSALEDDAASAVRPDADRCGEALGTEVGKGALVPGRVRLRDCKRPRPLILRVNAGDVLELRIGNLLRPDQPGISGAYADAPQQRGPGFCEMERSAAAQAPVRADILHGFDTPLVPPFQPSQCREAEAEGVQGGTAANAPGADWPRTRGLSLVIPGLEPVPVGGRIDPACNGLGAIAPGAGPIVCRWKTEREGTHLFSSLAAPAGGEGEGGSNTHGLFGAVIVEAKGSRYFRSQVTAAAFDAVWGRKTGANPHARGDSVSFAAAVPDPAAGDPDRAGCQTASATVPVIEMTRPCPVDDVVEIVHGDLNAVVVPGQDDPPAPIDSTADETARRQWRERHEARAPFREFSVVFHDELKTYYADAFKQLARFGQLSGIRDGFAINYGASGVGSAVLANRLGIGPAANCPECLYEEFFLESWANGDPALLEAFPDDPSNVHHSYLNDKVVFRNFHVGKETHVFHLHSHQWFAGNDAGRGAYLDSQTIGPQQGFTYRIYHGGLERFAAERGGTEAPGGWWDSLGTGNRNRTPGDAIFHCHLYPHFAQGMWALWRVHDVLEDGSRLLPDGQDRPGLSVAPNPRKGVVRAGSVGPAGAWVAPGPGGRRALGTPVPGLVPLPGHGLPPLPTYTAAAAAPEPNRDISTDAVPGYPFYIAGRPGHRSPQPPLDMARAEVDPAGGIEPRHIAALAGRKHLDGGLPRHVVTGGVAVPRVLADIPAPLRDKTLEAGGLLARMLARGDMTSDFERLDIELLPQEGTALERNAMRFHAHGSGVAVMAANGADLLPEAPIPEPAKVFPSAGEPLPADPKTRLDPARGAYPMPRIPIDQLSGEARLQQGGWFAVNGANGANGAPFADPCGAPLLFGQAGGPKHRRYDARLGEWQGEPVPFASMQNPFKPDAPLVPDPGLLGFRRFHVSAVPLTLVVNRAGWHDPQGRTNVLSAEAHATKNRIRSDAEPFYFRAFSGECLEVRHTNETPKDLDLDDFQMKVPTDTIGQHIHLVKFDVTSSDGSGNGFNYEDGTFAPDEVLERICTATNAGSVTRRPGEAAERFEPIASRSPTECGAEFKAGLRRLQRLEADNIKYFQTTVQRWFADPILSDTGETGRRGVADRTMRTVFTHDHFGPSNIQQHGFYSALLIEPASHAVCAMAEPRSATGDGKLCVLGPAARAHPSLPTLALDPSRHLVGARANVLDYGPDRLSDGASGDPLHLDAREYAIAIADFALLYDGRRDDRAEPVSGGIDQLIREAENPAAGHVEDEAGESPPARFLSDQGIALNAGERGALAQRRNDLRTAHGRPVAPPPRPEAISQKHHDPYLVNYRNEPVPLRIGTKAGSAQPAFLSNPCRTAGAMASLPGAGERADSIDRQRSTAPGRGGDLADLFKSDVHGDPCTPILEGLSGDRIVARIIQGAQEVQHTFMVEARTGRRNVDQPFPTERPMGPEGDPAASRAAACAAHPVAKWGDPRAFPAWANKTPASAPNWPRFERLLAGCDNPMGFVAAQEIGISEHFEIGGLFSAFRSEIRPFLRAGSPRPAAATALDPSARPALDRLYHFGSTDAVWNGAWGLVRSYESPDSPDLSRCLWRAPTSAEFDACLRSTLDPIASRLTPLRVLRRSLNGLRDEEDTLRSPTRNAGAPGPLSFRPVAPGERLSCRPNAKASVVAVRADAVLPNEADGRAGLRYGERLFDPDGLLLVPIADPPPNVDRARLIAAAKEALGVDTVAPLVIRIRAGDCLDLTLFNALPPDSRACTGRKSGDRFGDAPMPKIVPLNVDCDGRQFGESKSFDEWGESGGGRPDIAPSARLALSIPLPAPQGKPAGTLPVGVNDVVALASAPLSGPAPRTATEYYAGFIWAEEDKLASEAKGEFKKITAPAPASQTRDPAQAIGARFGARSLVPLGEIACSPDVQIVVLGRHFCMVGDPDTGKDDPQAAGILKDGRDLVQARLVERFADPALADRIVRKIPYAFGVLPIRSVGDIVSHGAHGLLGTVVVEPEGAELRSDRGSAQHAAALTIGLPCLDLARTDGQAPPASCADDAGAGTIPGADIREQVLVWQDGLNLRGQLRPAVSDRGSPGRPLPDCTVCDDSYDLGEIGVSYRSEPFFHRLVLGGSVPGQFGLRSYPRDGDDLNTVLFPPDFFVAPPATPAFTSAPGQELAIRIAHPAGRARQRAFVPLFSGYDDLFPGFGSGHSALIGPGKALTAWARAPAAAGCYLWRDGPQPLFAGGAWGQLRVGDGLETCRPDASAP